MAIRHWPIIALWVVTVTSSALRMLSSVRLPLIAS